MKINLSALFCMTAAATGLTACTPSKTTPDLPPLVMTTTVSPEQAAIQNSNMVDTEAAARSVSSGN